MTLFSRQLVLKKVAISFPDPLAARQALEALDRYGKHPNHPAVHAVHLAIIKLSEGKLWRLRELVKAAKHDFRDVLYSAEAPERFQRLRENPLSFWGGLPRKKTLAPAKQAAMERRDQKQWIEWLTS